MNKKEVPPSSTNSALDSNHSSWKRWLLFIGFGAVSFASVFSLLLAGGLYLYINPRYQAAMNFDLAKLERQNHEQDGVRYDEISGHFINALLAIEDPDFKLRNVGVSPLTLKLVDQVFGEEVQSGVQLCLAHRIEQELDKSQVLELYINRMYFGNEFYGIGEASTGYFGKPAKALNVAEAATLAGVIEQPHQCSPRLFPTACRDARDSVLVLMTECGFIDLNTQKLAKESPLNIASEPVTYREFK